MNYSVRWDISEQPVATPTDVEAFVTEQLSKTNVHGSHGHTFWFGLSGTRRRDMPLRVDVDPDAGAAAVHWMPDATIADEPAFEPRPILVSESSYQALRLLPSSLARTSITSAIRASVEYVMTGDRPTSLAWSTVDESASDPVGVWVDRTPINADAVRDVVVWLNLAALRQQHRSVSTRWGPVIRFDELRGRFESPGPLSVDLVPVLNRAAVQWEPTGEIAVEPQVLPPIEEMWEAVKGTNSPRDAYCTTIDGAVAVISAFVASAGERPKIVAWQSTPE